MNKIFTFFFLLISFLGFGQGSLKLIYNWSDSTLMGSQAFNNTYNETWGFISNNIEYGVIGSTEGTHIFNLSDTSNISENHFIEGKFRGRFVIHRDYHDYNGFLYAVCDEGQSSLQIIDISNLPQSAPVVYDEDSIFSRSHNIFIDTANAMLYSCGGDDQLMLISLANPTEPKLVLNCRVDVPFWSSIGYIHDIYVEDGIAFCNAGTRGFFIVDFNDLSNPVLLGSLTQYPDQGYNHSGWLHPNKKIYAMADETWGMDIKILDVSDPQDIKVVSQINSNIHPNSIVHNLIFKGDILYVSYYYDGVYMYDLSNPESPQLMATYATSSLPHRSSYEGCWGVYPFFPSGILLASDMQEGLFVFDANTILNTHEIKNKNTTIELYPNPFNQLINFNNQAEFKQLRLQDISGKTLQDVNLKPGFQTINFSQNLPTGFYIIQLIGPNFTATKKMIKN